MKGTLASSIGQEGTIQEDDAGHGNLQRRNAIPPSLTYGQLSRSTYIAEGTCKPFER